MSDSLPEDWIGRVIDDRYRITELIGEGGMGSVFAAEHLTLRRTVAIKIVRPEYAGNAELAQRFAREAMVTSRIDHPNVISAIDFGTLEDGAAYLTMQLFQGQGIHQILAREGSVHWSRVAGLGAQVADALCAAAAEGIVHRDLKPENILVQGRDDGTDLVKVLDFGIAKFTRDSLAPPSMRSAQQVTQTGMVIGTPGYMSPEQAVGQRADHRSDLYALGVILWECLVGRRMWGGDDPREIIKNQLRGKPASPRVATGDLTIPEEFDALVMSLCDDSPAARPDDAANVRDRLRELSLQGRGLGTVSRAGRGPRTAQTQEQSRTIAFAERLVEPRETATPLTGESPTPRAVARGGRPRRGVSLLAVVTLLGLGVGAWLVLSGQLELRPRGELARVTDQLGPVITGSTPRPESDTDGAPEQAAGGQPRGATGLPLTLEPMLSVLVQEETRTARVEAARALLGHIPMNEVPTYVRGLAHMQLAETCLDKKQDGLSLLLELRDRRALPGLVLTSERGKSGCGPKGRRDCLGCMREELDQLIAQLEAQPVTP